MNLDGKSLAVVTAAFAALVAWAAIQLHATGSVVSGPTVALVAGALIPFVNAFATKLHATWEKTALAIFLAGVTAVGANVAGVKGSVSLTGLITTFGIAAITAGASVKWATGSQVNALAVATRNVGLGPSGPPAVDVDYRNVANAPLDPVAAAADAARHPNAAAHTQAALDAINPTEPGA